MHLSIIMPVYNAQDTLERTLRSIVSQLSRDVELVIVDDGSTDSTPAILSRFAGENAGACQVIRQENAGAAAARNAALDYARGDFLTFIDADDLFLDQAVETVLRELPADILGWDWRSVDDGKSRRFRQASYSTPEEALRNLMGGTMKWNLWLFAVKRSLVRDNGIRFLDGADMGEDMAFMLKCFSCAGDVKQIHEVLYEYNASNPSSISQQMNERRREEVSRNLASAEAFFTGKEREGLFRRYLPHLKLYIKLPLLIGLSKEDYTVWYGWFPESHAYAMGNPALPFRTRLLQWLASKKLWALVKGYNLVYRRLIRMRFNDD